MTDSIRPNPHVAVGELPRFLEGVTCTSGPCTNTAQRGLWLLAQAIPGPFAYCQPCADHYLELASPGPALGDGVK